jgi:hypothetical protein
MQALQAGFTSLQGAIVLRREVLVHRTALRYSRLDE